MSALTASIRRNFIQMSPPAKLVLILLLALFFMLLGSAVALLLAVPLFGQDLTGLYRILDNPENSNIAMLKFFQIIQSVFLFIFPALIAAWLFSENTVQYLRADRRASAYTLLLVFISLFVAIPMMNALALLNSRLDFPNWMHGLEIRIRAMEDSAGRLTELFLEGTSREDLAVNILMVAVLPAIGEEFLFRGVLQRIFADWTRNKHAGVIIAAFIFSFIHFQFYGFVPRLLLGLYFGYLMVWSASIWVPVTGHLINNGMAVFYYHFTKKPVGDTLMDTIGTNQGGIYVLYLSVLLTVLVIGIIYHHENKGRVPLL